MKHLQLFEQFIESINEGFKNTRNFEKFLEEIDGMPESQIKKIMGRDYIDTPGYYSDEKDEYDGIIDFMTSNMGKSEFEKLKKYWETKVAESVEYINEGRIALNHVYANAPVRNKVLEILKNGRVTEEEFMAAVSKAGAPSKWINRNSHFFKIEEEGGVKFYSLSKTGHVIMSAINESFRSEDIFFIWDETVDDDRKGIEQGHTSHKGKPATRYDFYLPNSKKKVFSDFKEEAKDFLKKKGLKYDWDGDSLFVYESAFEQDLLEIYEEFGIEENLVVDPLDLTQDFFYVSINGKTYGYQAKPGGNIEDIAKSFNGMLKYSAGKALAWLKKNADLAYGGK